MNILQLCNLIARYSCYLRLVLSCYHETERAAPSLWILPEVSITLGTFSWPVQSTECGLWWATHIGNLAVTWEISLTTGHCAPNSYWGSPGDQNTVPSSAKSPQTIRQIKQQGRQKKRFYTEFSPALHWTVNHIWWLNSRRCSQQLRSGVTVFCMTTRHCQHRVYHWLEQLYSVSPAQHRQETSLCSPGQRLRLYCSDCDTAVCSSCSDIEHRDHPTLSLELAMKTERDNMRTATAQVQEKLPSIKKSIQSIKLTSESLGHKEEDLDDSINDTFDQLVAMLEQRRTCLLNQLHFRVASKRDKLGKDFKILNI